MKNSVSLVLATIIVFCSFCVASPARADYRGYVRGLEAMELRRVNVLGAVEVNGLADRNTARAIQQLCRQQGGQANVDQQQQQPYHYTVMCNNLANFPQPNNNN